SVIGDIPNFATKFHFLQLKTNIRKVVALLLLGCFVFSNTPKTFLHQVFAGHTDYIVVCEHSEACIHQDDVDCHFDDLVVNASYVLTAATLPPLVEKTFQLSTPHFYASVYKPSWFQFRDYTGPPLTA
ncbi:MAG TPA: hypothetical protein VF610_04665, partial [Segetibacter sp.]